MEAALAEGFMLNVVQGNVIRLLPPFLVERSHVDEMIAVLRRLLAEAVVSAPATAIAATAR